MAAAKDSKLKSSSKEGVSYVSSTGLTWGSSESTKEKPDVKKLKNLRDNIYGRGISEKQKLLIFTERYSISVTDKNGKDAPDVAIKIDKMTSDTVDLWTRMKQTYDDVFWYGISLFNPVWKWGDGGEYAINEYYLAQLRRLPPETFAQSPSDGDSSKIYSTILKGITLDDQRKPVYYQTDEDGNSKEIKNIFVVKDPTSPELAGEPIILPLSRVITMLDYTWLAQMQKVNRTGSPIMFIRIDPSHPEAQPDDNDYAKKILENWGKNTAYTLRPNMELISTQIKDTADNLETINTLSSMILDYFSPAKFVSKDGTLIGGSSASEIELLQGYIRGVHSWIEQAYTALLTTYLKANQYDGYTLKITIPTPSIDKSELLIKAVEVGVDKKLITKEEGRKNLPLTLSPMTDDLKKQLAEDYPSEPSGPGNMLIPSISPSATKPEKKAQNATEESIEETEEKNEEALTQKSPKPPANVRDIGTIEDEEIRDLTRIIIATENSVMNALSHLEKETEED